MHTNSLISISFAALAASSLAAQGSDYIGDAHVFFTMDNTVGLNSINTTNEAAVLGDEAIFSIAPGADAFARTYTDFGFWDAYLGDEDMDGDYSEGIIGSVDALYIPASAPASPSLHDIYLSIQTPVDAGGALGVGISDGDIFRIRRDGTIETFLSQADIITAANSTDTNLDVNGFTVDQSNGDLYLTFTAGVDVLGTDVADGGVMRIPGSAYTLAGGVVTAMTAGTAEIVLTEADTDAIFIAAGFPDGVTDLTGIEIDPTGGTFTSTDTGLTMPNLWLCDDDFSDESIVSTVGVIPTVNGVALTAGPGMGLSPMDPFGGANDNPFAIAFLAKNPTAVRPMIVDQFPAGFTTPITVDVGIGGATPNSSVFLILEVFDASPIGAFPARLPNLSLISPIPLASPSFELFFGPGAAATLALVTDAEGFAAFPLNLPPVMANIGFTWQAVDLANFNFSTPTTTEAN
ncbi:MAG: hypothetical protein AAF196_12190 [Planctomycetota bacterium]